MVYSYCTIIAEKNASILLIDRVMYFFCKACFISYSLHDYTCASGGKFTVDYELFVMGIKESCTNV